jgi:hypothetical protein
MRVAATFSSTSDEIPPALVAGKENDITHLKGMKELSPC